MYRGSSVLKKKNPYQLEHEGGGGGGGGGERGSKGGNMGEEGIDRQTDRQTATLAAT